MRHSESTFLLRGIAQDFEGDCGIPFFSAPIVQLASQLSLCSSVHFDVYAAFLNTGITTPKFTLLEILCTLETKMNLVW